MIPDWPAVNLTLSTPGPNLAETVIARTGVVRPADGLYTSETVEVGVEPKRGNPLPRYPSVLRDMGVEGSFTVHFVVDSTWPSARRQNRFSKEHAPALSPTRGANGPSPLELPAGTCRGAARRAARDARVSIRNSPALIAVR